MNFSFNLGELVAIVGGAVFVGGMIESVRRLTVSSTSQGKRLGEIDKWIEGQTAVQLEREKVRRRADTRGVPITTDE